MSGLKATLGALLVVAVPVVITPATASAQLTKVGTVTTLLGSATVTRAAVAQPAPLAFKDDIYVRDRITTGDDSIVRVLLGGKAMVTVRERSSVTITEAPGTATIEMGAGKIAVAAVKERFKRGETVEIKTPNAVAAIRGTVVITEVDSITAQVGGAPAAFRTVTTVLSGIVAYRAGGTSLTLNALDQVRRTGVAAPVAQRISRDDAGRLANTYHVKTPPPLAPPAVLGGAQVAANEAIRGALQRPVQQPAIAAAVRTAAQEIQKIQNNKGSGDRPETRTLRPSLTVSGGGGVAGELTEALKDTQKTQQQLNSLSAAERSEVKALLSSNGGNGGSSSGGSSSGGGSSGSGSGLGTVRLPSGKTIKLEKLELSGDQIKIRGRN